MKAIGEAEPGGTDYVPSSDCPPTAIRQIYLRILFFFQNICAPASKNWHLYFVTRQWMKVAIKTLLRSVPTQNRSPPPKAMKCFVPPVISTLSCTSDTHKHCLGSRETCLSSQQLNRLYAVFMSICFCLPSYY